LRSGLVLLSHPAGLMARLRLFRHRLNLNLSGRFTSPRRSRANPTKALHWRGIPSALTRAIVPEQQGTSPKSAAAD
jgi:hypothetical protein